MIKDIPHIGEYIQIGLIGAIELVKNKKTQESFNSNQRVVYEIYKIALREGVVLRPLGNIIYFMPPFIISEEEIYKMIEVAK